LCSLIGYHCTKVDTKYALVFDEKNNRLLCCVSVRDFESKVKLIKGINLTHLKRKCSIES